MHIKHVGTSMIAVLAVLAVSNPALAEEQPASETSSQTGLGDIIVTARKVSERLQDVPVAITAFDNAALERQNAIQLSDVARLAPGLTILTQTINGASNAFFTMRGQTQRSNLATVDPSVGVYVDGVYWARAYGINANLLDVANLQVLRGPQGTLFGRNTTGGAVLINTSDPDLNDFSGKVEASYGRFNYKAGTAIVNAPIVEGKVAARLALQFVDDDGYVKSITFPDKTYGEQSNYTMRAKISAQLTDTTNVLLSADIFREDRNPDTGELRYVPSAATSATRLFGLGPRVDAVIARYQGKEGREIGNNIDNQSETHTDTFALTVNQETPIGDLKFIGAYRKVRSTFFGDYDGSELAIMDYGGLLDMHQWTGELTLTGNMLADRLSYAAGLFYFDESGRDRSNFLGLGALGSTRVTRYDGDVFAKSIGIYGQASYKITDELSFTGGLRWSQDKKGVTMYNGNASGNIYLALPERITNASPPVGGLPGCVITAGCPTTRRGKFDGVSWTAGFDYKITPDVLAYIKASRGFRSGGVNLRENTLIPGIPIAFAPEKVTSYEGGIKSDFFDHRVRFNLAGYYQVQKDSQREYTVSQIVNGASVNITVDVNAERVDFWGGEAELTAVLVDTVSDRFTVSANGSYTKPKYKGYNDVVTGFDKTRELLPFIPEWTASISGAYDHEFEGSKLSLNATYNWDSGFPFTEFNYYTDGTEPAGFVRSASNGSLMPIADAQGIKHFAHINKSGTLDLRAAFTFGEADRYQVALWGKNVLDDRTFVFSNTVYALGVSSARRPPATYGITGTVNF